VECISPILVRSESFSYFDLLEFLWYNIKMAQEKKPRPGPRRRFWSPWFDVAIEGGVALLLLWLMFLADKSQ